MLRHRDSYAILDRLSINVSLHTQDCDNCKYLNYFHCQLCSIHSYQWHPFLVEFHKNYEQSGAQLDHLQDKHNKSIVFHKQFFNL